MNAICAGNAARNLTRENHRPPSAAERMRCKMPFLKAECVVVSHTEVLQIKIHRPDLREFTDLMTRKDYRRSSVQKTTDDDWIRVTFRKNLRT
jgi:hypothetical protein